MKHRKNLSLPVSPSSSCSAPHLLTLSSGCEEASSPAVSAPVQTGWDHGSRAPTVERDLRAEIFGPRASRALVRDEELAGPDFVELLGRSAFSFLQGASQPEEMVLRAKQLKYCGLAISDVNGLYGVVRGFQASERPSAFDAEQLATLRSDGQPIAPFHYICGSELTPHNSSSVVLLPMNKDGYVRLSRLITFAKRKAPKGHISLSLQEILDANEDLIAIPLPPWREEDLVQLQNAFQDRIYLPVQKDFTWESIQLYQQAMKLEQQLGLTLFATNRPLFHAPERKPLHDVLTCILHKTTLREAKTHLTLNRERYLKSSFEIARLFRERPDLLSRTLEIAARIEFSLTELRYRYPHEELPAGQTATTYLRKLVEDGLIWRYGSKFAITGSKVKVSDVKQNSSRHYQSPLPQGMSEAQFCTQVLEQVEHELQLISDMEFEDYFLTLKDICNFADSKGILHQGRGSAANSIVCFAIGLTNVDPVRMGLLFERFIAKERGEPPDIDIDFEHDRREEVIQYIYQKYGEEKAAMVSTVICYRSRMAIREVAKVMDIAPEQIEKLVKQMGREGLTRLIDEPVQLEQLGLTERKFRKLLQLTVDLQGFPRHLGIHSGGFVISNEAIINIVPVENATMENRYVIQWNKDDINTLGLMKIDVLSLGMLSALRRSLDLLKEHKGIEWNLAQIPADDEPTYKMIQRAETIGVFQIESRAQMSLLPRLKPKDYYDLVIEVAIVRPGPIQGGMVHPYLKRRAGQEKTTYAHPKLEPILKKTLGIPLFQEQIMQVVVAVAGFTPGEADELRRIMSSAWKKAPVMDGVRQRVINGMLANQISVEYAERIYKTIEGFSSYGFPESHAASFALLTYASCFLKQHHPDLFTCALLNSQPMGFYSPRQLIHEAQRNGVMFLPLDIQHSVWDYKIHDRKPNSDGLYPVRVGLRSIHGLNETQMQTLVHERETKGIFHDLASFIQRTGLSKACVIRLGAAGALSCFNLTARESLWRIQSLSFDQHSLFLGRDHGLDEDRQNLESAQIPREDDWQSVQREYHTKGFSIDQHPLGVLRPHLLSTGRNYILAAQIKTLRNGTRIRIAGLRSLLQKPPTAKGMCFASLEDETGIFNVVITPDIYEKCRLILVQSPLLDVDGILESREGVYNIKARVVLPLLPPREVASLDRAKGLKAHFS